MKIKELIERLNKFDKEVDIAIKVPGKTKFPFYDIYPMLFINLQDGDPARPRFVFLKTLEDEEDSKG